MSAPHDPTQSTVPTADERAARVTEARRLRSEEGLSKRQIAARLSVSTGTLSEWLRGVPAPTWTSRPNAKDDVREQARALRRQAFSVADIAAELQISKSTASLWVRDIPLDEDMRRGLFQRKHSSNAEHARMMAEARWADYRAERDQRREQTMQAAGDALPGLSHAEVLRMGALLYWCEGSKAKPWRPLGALEFVNSDPGLITLYMGFLRCCEVVPNRIKYRLLIHASADEMRARSWWAAHVGVTPDRFAPSTIKKHNPKTVRHNTGDSYRGCLAISVRKSRELYWQIEGMVTATLRSVAAAAAEHGSIGDDQGGDCRV